MIGLSEFVVNAAVEPSRPLTPAQLRVADLLARGWAYKHIAHRLNCRTRTIESHVQHIANALPEDGLAPSQRVMIWALCRAIKALGTPRAA